MNDTVVKKKGFRNWVIGAGAFAGAVMAIIALANQFGLKFDRPAWASELEQVKELSLGTRQIILTDKWFQTQEKLENIQRKRDYDPENDLLIDMENQLERQLRNIELQQKELEEMGNQ